MLDPNLHRQTMLRVLKDIYTNSTLASLVGFKGGTAAYLLYSLPRFSVDLDFDLLDPIKKDYVFRSLAKILGKYGQLEESSSKYYTPFYLLSYRPGLQKLKVEISHRLAPSSYEAKQFLGLPLLVATRADMFAHKLAALTTRKRLANRDVFDIHFFFDRHWPLNIRLLEQRVGMKYVDYLKKCIGLIETIPAESLLANLGELVDSRQKDWIRRHLKEEVLFLLKLNLES